MLPNPRRSFSSFCLALLALAQVFSATYMLTVSFLQPLASAVFVLSGIAISWCCLYLPLPVVNKQTFFNRQTIPKFVVYLALLPLSYRLARAIMDGTPLQIEHADMLPIIGVMCRRFLSGNLSEVYQPIPEIWNGIQPIYLPALWLPFCFSLHFQFDMRWTTVCGIWGSVALCLLPAWRNNKVAPAYVLSLLLLLAWLHLEDQNNVIRLTEEGVVAFYYSLLAVSVLCRNAWLIGMAAALCLVSRYALIGWLPVAALILLQKKEYRFLIKAIVAGGLTTALLIVPFGFWMLSVQAGLPAQYVAHAKRVWQENANIFYYSPGLAKFFGPAHAGLLHTILVWGSFVVPLLFFLLAYKKVAARTNFLLAGLQLSLTFFYAFVDVPYLYLFYTPVFVSLVIAGWALTSER